MKIKKMLSMVLTVSMVSGLPAAVEAAPARISDETIAITLAGPSTTRETGWDDTIQFKGYERDLGIKFESTTYSEEQWASKLPILLAMDEMPDMIVEARMTKFDVEKYGSEGYFLDFNEYLDIMPNFAAMLEKYPEYKAALTCADGGIYGLAKLNNMDAVGMFGTTFLNTQWLENLGLEIPASLDELYDVLVAFRDQDANGNGDASDEIPFGYVAAVVSTDMPSDRPILWSFDIPCEDTFMCLMVDENGKVVLGDTTDNYKAYLKYMNKLYAEGLIAEDAYAISGDEHYARLEQDRYGMVGTWAVLPGATDEDRVNNYTVLSGFTGEYQDENIVVIDSRVGTEYKIAVNANTEYAEEICKFIDSLYTEEGFVAARFGYEGESFDYKEIVGSTICDQSAYQEAYEAENPGKSFDQAAWAHNLFTICEYGRGGAWGLLPEVSDEELHSLDVINAAGQNLLREEMLRRGEVKEISKYRPGSQADTALAQEAASLQTDIYTYLQSAKAEFIIGNKDIDTEWDAHLAELEKMGLQRYLELEQIAYDNVN